MKRNALIGILVILFGIGSFLVYKNMEPKKVEPIVTPPAKELPVKELPQVEPPAQSSTDAETSTGADYKNISYMIGDTRVLLVNGMSEITTDSGASSKITTKYFGNEVNKDLNNDGREDIVFLVTQETGGSGVFFYAVAALNTGTGYVGSQAVLLGDRIAPQTTESGEGNTIIVNYMTHSDSETMADQPSVGKSLYLTFNLETMKLEEVSK